MEGCAGAGVKLDLLEAAVDGAMTANPALDAEAAKMRAVAEFYADLVFPSRGSHPAYARLAQAPAGARVGDFGCGPSLFRSAWREHHPEPTYLDRSLPALRTLQGCARVCADLGQLPLGTATFDRILCIGVMHHLPIRAPIWRELHRVLRPGARLVVGVYAPGTLQAGLRQAHASTTSTVGRRAITFAMSMMLRARYAAAGRPLPAEAIRARTRDFLEVPHVEYRPIEDYAQEAAAGGLVLSGRERIAGMNLLFLDKPLS